MRLAELMARTEYTDGAQARFQDGVLEVSIPMPRREQQQKNKQLEIR